MNGRRSHVRFVLNPSSEGTLCVLRDIVVEGAHGDEIVVVSREAGVIGETMVAVTEHEASHPMRVEIVESRPIVLDGTVRHRLRLRKATAAGENDPQTPSS